MQKLRTALAKATEDLRLMNDTVAEATDLFAEGKLSQENLDRVLQDRDRAVARKASLEERIAAAEANVPAQNAALKEAQRKAAVVRTRNLLKDRDECAADLDSAINTLLNNVRRLAELNEQANLAAYESGFVDPGRRQHLLSLRPVGAALAASLRRTNLVDGLVFITVAGSIDLKSVTEMVAGENRKIAASLGQE